MRKLSNLTPLHRLKSADLCARARPLVLVRPDRSTPHATAHLARARFCARPLLEENFIRAKVLKFSSPGKKKKTGELAGSNQSSASSSKPAVQKRSKQKLLQPESNDFKLVFISSGDSSKDSDQLNSSLENGPDSNVANNNAPEFIHNSDYEEDELTSVSPPDLPPKSRKNLKNLNLIEHYGLDERMSMSTSGTSIRTAATRDRHSPILRSPRIPKIRNIPVQHSQNSGNLTAPSMDDRSITEMSIHDMQLVMNTDPSVASVLSRSLSESDLSEICGNGSLGGAAGSDPPSPVHMLAPSDEDDSTGKN